MVPESDDMGSLWTRPKLVGISAIVLCGLGAFLVVLFASQGKILEALLVTTSVLCLLVVGVFDMLAAIIKSTRRMASVLENQQVLSVDQSGMKRPG